ncbi:MAG TPA: type II secretion system F family protein [Candidatus Pacearchaeota archaeon]|nr:type II secretion system F family protein [Candidatus Pacearchaeota archaeon]HPR79686.1 type II secretion system F family protein [Candidatus Pacearchaeota archaeon]
MKYLYQAKDIKGVNNSGVIEATSKEAALEVLNNNGLFPIEIKGEDEKNKDVLNKKISIKLFSGTSMKDVAMFSRQLAIMIDSNVPPAEAIDALGDQTRNQDFKEKIYIIANDVRSGTQMSKAFGKFPQIFSPFYINMMKSAEVSGNLPSILNKVADHLESEYAIRSKMIGAATYPMVVMVIFVLIFIVLMIFVIPGLVKVLIESGQELPIATKIIIAISDFFVKFWYLAIGGIIGIAAFFVYYPKTIKGKDVFDKIAIKIPIFGPFLKNLFLTRFAENFSTLISAGLPINEALEVVANLIGNNIYRDTILKTRDRVVKGESISMVLGQYNEVISPLFVQMVSVGEKTGRLDSSLANVVRFYKRETDIFVDSLSSIIEPILIIGLALMVGFLVAAVLLPIYQISTTVPK